MERNAPAEEEEVGRGAEDGEHRHYVLVHVRARRAARHRQDHKQVGHQEQRLRRRRFLQSGQH